MAETAIQRIERYLKKHYDFRYNIVTCKVEYKRRTDKKFLLLSDYQHNSILRELARNRINCTPSTLKNLLFSDFVYKYDPLRSYFHSLRKFDGKSDYIRQLSETVKTTSDNYWHYAFKKWIVATVACALDEKVVNHTAIIFSGFQGSGKTTWLEALVPRELKEYQFSGTINLANKDSAIQLAECFLINMDELENMNSSDIGKLKQIITQGVIRVRRPYAVYSESYIRRASFTGSVNSAQFLNDSTGSRRFLSFEVKSIKYMHNVNLDLVYSQALALYRSGFKFYFDKKTTTMVNSKNETFAIQTPEEEYLLRYFKPISVEKADTFMNASSIIEHIEKQAGIRFKGNANIVMGKVLQKHNFVKTKSKGLYVYALKERILDTN